MLLYIYMSEISPTFYLFSRPSFSKGYGRILDISGSFNSYNASKNEEEADFIAINNDWRAIGKDIAKSIDNYKKDESKK